VARFDRTVPAGGEGTITLEVKTKGYEGNFHKTALVFTNDPKNPEITIGMKGRVWAPIHLNPKYISLTGISGEKIEKVLRMRGEMQEPLIVKVASVSIPDKVEVELTEIEKGRSWDLRVENRVKTKASYKGQVELTTNYPEKPEIVVPIYGGVRAIIQVRPESLSFGRVSEERLEELKRTGGFMSRPLMVVLNRGNDLEILKVELEKSLFKIVTRQTQHGRRSQLLVEPILDKLTKGVNEDRLKIYTNYPEHETIVPISLEVL